NMDLLCLVSKTQPAIAVRTDSPCGSYEEFLAAVRARPGYYVVGNSGTGSIWHINALLLARHNNLQLVHCPFSGSSGSLTALLGGHIDAAVAGAGEIVPHVKAGRLRPLAVFADERSRLFPEVPAVAETGEPFGASAWSGFYAPKGLPEEVRAKLTSAIRAAFESPEFQKICEERGMDPVFLDGEAFARFSLKQASFFAATLPALLGGKQQ
ncbi:MAG: tripartite tricarboxylate transporter substrate binding protein, partial [bacterium]|nr:tripartite tricarboxylate transporter substrate binding protein [bacterium]